MNSKSNAIKKYNFFWPLWAIDNGKWIIDNYFAAPTPNRPSTFHVFAATNNQTSPAIKRRHKFPPSGGTF